MEAKRNKVNEYIIRCFLNGDWPGYSSSHNGVKYFVLEINSLYGGHILKLKTDMGWRILTLTDNEECITNAANLIQETLIDLPKIIKRGDDLAKYLTSEEGKWGRQDSF